MFSAAPRNPGEWLVVDDPVARADSKANAELISCDTSAGEREGWKKASILDPAGEYGRSRHPYNSERSYKKMPTKKCTIEGCTRPVDYPKTGLCNTCYQYVHYWLRKRSVRKIMARAETIAVWQARLETLVGRKTKGKVTRLARRRRRSAA